MQLDSLLLFSHFFLIRAALENVLNVSFDVTTQAANSMLSLPSSPSPFSHWEKGSQIEVPLLRERDLG